MLNGKYAFDDQRCMWFESATANVHCAFDKALKDSLTMQDDIYKKMAAKGWYPSEQAEPQKIQKVKQKYSANATN